MKIVKMALIIVFACHLAYSGVGSDGAGQPGCIGPGDHQ